MTSASSSAATAGPLVSDDERGRVLGLLRRYGWNATSFQVLERGFRYWFDGDSACVAYVDTGGAWVAAGAPIARTTQLADVARRAAMRLVASEGGDYVTLGLAPLAGPVGGWLHLARDRLSLLYDFHGVRAFKARLHPDAWEPIYLAHPAGTSGNVALYDALAAFARGSFARFGVQTALRGPAIVVRRDLRSAANDAPPRADSAPPSWQSSLASRRPLLAAHARLRRRAGDIAVVGTNAHGPAARRVMCNHGHPHTRMAEAPVVRTIIEPFKIKVVEPIPFSTPKRRRVVLTEAGWNLFRVPAAEVTIDLLTDSGTSAMSAAQWAGIQIGDESYAGSRSFYRFERTIQQITGMAQVIPVHQGRAGEHLLFSALCRAGDVVFGNTHFDTTRANIETRGACAVDLPCRAAVEDDPNAPFKGDIDLAALAARLEDPARPRTPFVLMTLTNNSLGGQPVSYANLAAVRALCDRHGVPLFLDAARFAENAWFIKLREPAFQDQSPRVIARALFDLADGCLMSAKKDGFGNIGGFIALRSTAIASELRTQLVLTEGFPTYGGLAGRDLEALAIGLDEVLDEDYLRYRVVSTAYVVDRLHAADVPVVRPAGGHAVYVDAARFLPHVAPLQLPGQTVACELFIHGGIRSCELGTLMFGRHEGGIETAARAELVRLAIPRRVYTQSHMDYVIEAVCELHARRHDLRGMRIVEQPRMLRHFTARLEPLS